MEVLITYDGSQSLFTVSYSGNIDKESLTSAIIEYTSHPEWGPDVKLMLDYQECSLRNLSPQEVEGMAKATSDLSDKIGPIRMGIVMSDHHDYGMARFWQVKSESESSFQCKVFLSPEKAKEWLIAE